MLATLTHNHFSHAEWIYERKFDGERTMAFRKGARAWLLTRNRKDISDTYPEVIGALERQHCDDFVVDGEIVAFEGSVSSFARLQKRMQIRDRRAAGESGIAVYFYLFDIIHLDGFVLEDLPLRARKSLLKRSIQFDDPLRYTRHRNGQGEAYYRDACERGWEGVIAKRADSVYRHRRTNDWLKFKCAKGQELVIGGFTAPKGNRKGFGALLVGYYDDDDLRYAGKVGTGYDDEQLTKLRARMDGMVRETSPFVDSVREPGATWIAPKLVGEFGFTEWTPSGKLRHPRFLGLRRDKNAKDVVREKAV